MSIPGPNPSWSVQPASGYQINSTAISADGTRMITGTSIEGGSAAGFGIYCYGTTDGRTGTLLWSDLLGRTAYDGIFWVAMSANGQYAAAGGAYTNTGSGFVRIYNVAQGASSRVEFATSSRVNEIEMSADGTYVVAVYGSTVALYSRLSGSYQLAATQVLANDYVRTCAISPDGTWIVAAGQKDSGDLGSEPRQSPALQATVSPGFLTIYINQQGTLEPATSRLPAAGVLRVVMSGAFIAASTQDGTIYMYSHVFFPDWEQAWTFKPSGVSVGVSYALAIAPGQDGNYYVAAGCNNPGSSPSSGWIYVVKNLPVGGLFQPQLMWIKPTQYAPNPATNMDANATYVTAGDGQPIGGGQETPGNFYLFDAMTGNLYWSYPTSIMNWAMAINARGTACFGGSDNGFVYYWGSPA